MSIYVCRECNDAAFQHLNRELENKLVLTRDEVLALDSYFTHRAGYISREFDPLVHDVIDKITGFVRRKR